MVYEGSEDEMHSDLREAVRAGLVLHSEVPIDSCMTGPGGSVLLDPRKLARRDPSPDRRLLAAHTPPERRRRQASNRSQLNRGAGLITSAAEREQVAELNLIAGQRAKQSTAYSSALTYLCAGRALLPEDCWERCGTLTLRAPAATAECEFLTGALAEADECLAELARRDVGLPDLAAVCPVASGALHDLGGSDRAIEVCPRLSPARRR